MNQSLNHLSSGAESVAQHLDIINQLCDDLLSTFTPSREQVNQYASAYSASLSQQDFLITDETLRKIKTLDIHLGELYDIATEEQLLSNHHEIWTTIQEKIDLITQSLLHNNYFHMTYGWRITEVIEKLQTMSYSRKITTD
jgi:DNA repair ATPase RecN